MSSGLQADGEGLADVGFIVDDQDIQRSRFWIQELIHRSHAPAAKKENDPILTPVLFSVKNDRPCRC
jgi:hypothetical protein